MIKRYFEANKYKRAARNDIIKQAEETEEAIAEIMGPRHVHFMDAHPEIREFMEQVNKDEGQKQEEIVIKTGRKVGDLPDIKKLSEKKPKTKVKTDVPQKGRGNF